MLKKCLNLAPTSGKGNLNLMLIRNTRDERGKEENYAIAYKLKYL